MNIYQLQYFCALAETEHYTKAAKILSITQPSLTHSIKELEKELNVCLFTRQGRNIKINEYGKFLYNKVSPILADLEAMKCEMEMLVDPKKEIIKLSFLPSLAQDFIPKVIGNFLGTEGNGQVQFILNQSTTNHIKEDFKDNKVDIAFASNMEEAGITSIPILKQELLLITPLDHPLAKFDEINLTETADYPFIFYNETSGLRPVIDKLFKSINVEPKISFLLDDDTTVCGFVSANFGIAIVPNIYGLERYPIKMIKIKQPSYDRYIYLSYRSDRYMSSSVQRFQEFILNQYYQVYTYFLDRSTYLPQ
jgi:DNA-binding transcriptional LysR family regulator